MTNKALHPTSIAVWNVPAPVVVNRPFTVSVGVKCSVGCQLTGQLIGVRDAAGIEIGEGRLGETPSRGTSALYETVVNLVAPSEQGVLLLDRHLCRYGVGQAARRRVCHIQFSGRQAARTQRHGGGP